MTKHASATRARVVVVGAGVAGSVVAAQLANHFDVLVLERGGLGAPIHDPRRAMQDSSRFHAVPYPQGIGVGGGSRVNGLVFEQPPTEYWQSLVRNGLDVFRDVESDQRFLVAEQSAAGGEVDRALLAAHPHARPTMLATRNGERLNAWDRMSPLGTSIRTDTTVSRIMMRGDRAVAVATDSGEEVPADHVVLCAGAVSSATIAARSGLIDAETQLLDHPGLLVGVSANQPATDPFAGALVVERDTMIMSVNGPEGGLLVGLMSPHSKGSVRIGDDSVTIDRGLLSDSRDLERFRDAVRDVKRLMSHPAFADIAPIPGALDDDRWLDRVGESMWHAAGTMAMGRARHSTVDESGKLRRANNVWCMDASVLPDIPPVPLQAAVMMTASVLSRRLISLATS